jgi:hypothetical protein
MNYLQIQILKIQIHQYLIGYNGVHPTISMVQVKTTSRLNYTLSFLLLLTGTGSYYRPMSYVDIF